MGGSGSFGGGGGGLIFEKDKCGEAFYFRVSILPSTETAVWRNCCENDEVTIVLNTDTGDRLPRLEVRKCVDNFLIGLVPASSTGLINCIKDGWTYPGIIHKKSGNQYAPEINVRVTGIK